METIQEIMDYLVKDYNHQIVLIVGLLKNEIEVIFFDSAGMLCFHKAAQVYIVTHDRDVDGEQYLAKIPKREAQLILLHQKEDIQYILDNFNFSTRLDCYHAVYRQKTPIPINESPLLVRLLEEEEASFVAKYYHKDMEEEQIKERIQAKEMWGAFLENDCVGFIGLHEEGSLGMLEILPQYQGNGYGKYLEVRVINYLLEKGNIPFAQVEKNNLISLNLHRSLGFEITNKLIYWFF